MALNLARSKRLNISDDEAVARPPIWVDGRQRPKFELAAFAHVATAMAKRNLLPAMDEASVQLATLGQRVQDGAGRVTVPRVQALLPSHERVGAAILGLDGLFGTARDLIEPPLRSEAKVVYPDMVGGTAIRSNPTEEVEPTLQAIRSAMHGLPHTDLPARRPGKVPRATAASAPLRRGMARGLLGVLMLFAWPAGAVQALIYHLNGGDLRDWS